MSNKPYFPARLKALPVWILWKLEPNEKGVMTKVPYSAKYDGRAKANDPSTWATFDQVIEKLNSHPGEYNGIGIELPDNGKIVFIDIDHCIDENGELDERAIDILDAFGGNTFAEYSQSGKGIHIIALGEVPKSFNNRDLGVEVYGNKHFCAMTGNALYSCDLGECQPAIDYVFEKYRKQEKPKNERLVSSSGLRMTDDHIIKKASAASLRFRDLYAGHWEGLYQSQSEADLALCNILAFWADGDEDTIDRIFRTSGLYRKKWDREDYRRETIRNACENTTETISGYVSRMREEELSRAGNPEGESVNGSNGVPDLQYKPPDLSDAGNAELFSSWVKGRLLWCDALGWLAWDGQRWDQNDHTAGNLAAEFAKMMLEEALSEYKRQMRSDPDTGKILVPEAVKDYLKHAQKARSALSIQNMLSLSKHRLHIRAGDLDATWYELNTEAGIVDLRNGNIRPHDPAALCTKLAPFNPSNDSKKMEIWRQHLEMVSQGDPEWQEFDQMSYGERLYGRIFNERLEIHKGSGHNGKSTHDNAILRVFGDYGGTIDSTVLTTERQNRGASLATLRGKRLVICGELEEGQRLSISTLKKLASTDPLTIEEKYRQPETIQPSHHIVLYSNFLPKVGSTDAGTWRRITVLPFYAVMPQGDSTILNYGDRLVEEAGGAILAWLIEGAVKFYQAGCHIRIPDVVQKETEDYRSGEDWLQGFLSERCRVEPNTRERAGLLYEEYKSYTASVGDYCRRGTDFVKAMETAGFRAVTVNGKRFWMGVSINYAETGRYTTGAVG